MFSTSVGSRRWWIISIHVVDIGWLDILPLQIPIFESTSMTIDYDAPIKSVLDDPLDKVVIFVMPHPTVDIEPYMGPSSCDGFADDSLRTRPLFPRAGTAITSAID